MSLQIEWLGIAEGAVFDSRRALTLVGINQNLLYIDDFPSSWQTTIVVMAAEDGENLPDSPSSGSISIEIKDPTNGRVSSTSIKAVFERRHKDLPGSVVAVALVNFQLTRHGRYRISAELTPDGSTEPSSVLHRDIFVMPKEEEEDS
jgi:hypothetical protein